MTLRGRYVQLDGATVQPSPAGGHIPISVAGRGAKLLDVVAAHADVWEINLPPLPARVSKAQAALERACAARKRDPTEIGRSMWIFTRIVKSADRDAALAEFQRLNPWFHWLSDAERERAAVLGSAEQCQARLEEISDELRLDLTVVDLSGLDAAASHRTLEGLAPEKLR